MATGEEEARMTQVIGYTAAGRPVYAQAQGQPPAPPEPPNPILGAITGVATNVAEDAATNYISAYISEALGMGGSGGAAGAAGSAGSASAGGAAGPAGASSTTGGASSLAAGSTGAIAGGSILTALGGYGLYDTIDHYGKQKQDSSGTLKATGGGMASGAATGAGIGLAVGGPVGAAWGAGIGAAVGGLAGLGSSMWGSGKDDDQFKRDDAREVLQSLGMLDENYKLVGGSKQDFDFGLDGGARLPNVGINTDGESDRGYYDVDFSNPLAEQAVGFLNPIAQLLFQDDKVASDMVGYFTNYALQNSDTEEQAKNAILEIYRAAGITNSDHAGYILSQAREAGTISREDFDSSLYALGKLFEGTAGQGTLGKTESTSTASLLSVLGLGGSSRPTGPDPQAVHALSRAQELIAQRGDGNIYSGMNGIADTLLREPAT